MICVFTHDFAEFFEQIWVVLGQHLNVNREFFPDPAADAGSGLVLPIPAMLTRELFALRLGEEGTLFCHHRMYLPWHCSYFYTLCPPIDKEMGQCCHIS